MQCSLQQRYQWMCHPAASRHIEGLPAQKCAFHRCAAAPQHARQVVPARHGIGVVVAERLHCVAIDDE